LAIHFFRARKSRRAAHLYWAYETMKNRAADDQFQGRKSVRISYKNENEKSRVIDWLAGKIGGAALGEMQYSTWNKEEVNNLFAVLTLRDPSSGSRYKESRKRLGEEAWDKIAQTYADIVEGKFETVMRDRQSGKWKLAKKAYIDHYDSPRSRPQKLNFRPVRLAAVRHKSTGKVSVVNKRDLRAGSGKWLRN